MRFWALRLPAVSSLKTSSTVGKVVAAGEDVVEADGLKSWLHPLASTRSGNVFWSCHIVGLRISTSGSTDNGQMCVVQPYVDMELGNIRSPRGAQASMLSNDGFCI